MRSDIPLAIDARLSGRIAAPPLDGMRVLVTGASSGIGLAIAQALLMQGARVCITGRDASRLEDAQALLTKIDSAEVMSLAFDVGDERACFDAVAFATARWGGVDALVNNAGRHKAGAFIDTTTADFEDLFRSNVIGSAQLIRAVLPQMTQRRQGRIVNIASTAGKWGSVNQSAYNTSKHAVIGLTRCVALEVAKLGITVNAVCPGLVDTPLAHQMWEEKANLTGSTAHAIRDESLTRKIPIGRLIQPSEVCSLVAYLLSPAASGMTGQSILYDGGYLLV